MTGLRGGQVFTDTEGVRHAKVTLPSSRSEVASGDLTPELRLTPEPRYETVNVVEPAGAPFSRMSTRYVPGFHPFVLAAWKLV